MLFLRLRRVSVWLSLAIGLAGVGVWARSFWVRDVWDYFGLHMEARRAAAVKVELSRGRLQLVLGEWLFDQVGGIELFRDDSDLTRLGWSHYADVPREWGSRNKTLEKLGFRNETWVRTEKARRIKPAIMDVGTFTQTSRLVGVPIWLTAVPAVLIAGVWAGRRWGRRLRHAAGTCTNCGYDLRASPGRCPECGAEHGAEGLKGGTPALPGVVGRDRPDPNLSAEIS